VVRQERRETKAPIFGIRHLRHRPWYTDFAAASAESGLGAPSYRRVRRRVTISRAVDTLLRPTETWQAYRKAAEGMKREYRLYLHNADAYATAEDEASAYRLLVERVETIIAEEQQLFWQSQAKGGAQEEPPKPPDQDA